jgi:hypothetical protein
LLRALLQLLLEKGIVERRELGERLRALASAEGRAPEGPESA